MPTDHTLHRDTDPQTPNFYFPSNARDLGSSLYLCVFVVKVV